MAGGCFREKVVFDQGVFVRVVVRFAKRVVSSNQADS